MRIQHNILAMNAYRNYNTNTSALAKNLEKLSSGYKINRAGDDAAGLAISEKMRAQITGLNAAQKNVKDGISLVKTAEGAMQEIQDMLNRMDYLATQSANGTYDNEVDRANLQKEVDALKSEINRIADSANFNGIKLLDGSLADGVAMNSQTSLVSSDHLQLHKAGAEATYASFDIDLNQLLAGAVATATGSSFTFNVTVGSQTIEITAEATGTITAGNIIDPTKLTFKATAATATNISLTSGSNTAEFSVSLSNDGVLSFTMASATAGGAGIAASNFNAAMSITYSSAGNFKFSDVALKENCATQNVKNGVALGGTRLAHTQFELTADMVKSLAGGATMTLGSTSITFAKGTVTTATGAGAVGIKDLLDEKGNIKTDDATLEELAARITKAASGDDMFTVGATGKTIELQEKIDYYTATNGAVLLDSTAKLGKYATLSSSSAGKALVLQIGDTADGYNRLNVSVGDMHTSALKLDSVDISTPDGAKDAIQVIKDAINSVSSVRGDLGAVQNRLEHTANNLSVMAENIQDAESTIRDTDVAEEMMAYTKNNILIQSAQAMLAQANAVPQGVLQLLG